MTRVKHAVYYWLAGNKRQRMRMRAACKSERARCFSEEQARRRAMFALLLFCCSASLLTPVRAHERSSMWWENIVGCNFMEEDWLANFRMSKNTFNFLCNELRHHITRNDTVMRKAISVEHRIAIALWYLASNADFRTISHLFGVSKKETGV